jgi:hypothetical protein
MYAFGILATSFLIISPKENKMESLLCTVAETTALIRVSSNKNPPSTFSPRPQFPVAMQNRKVARGGVMLNSGLAF